MPRRKKKPVPVFPEKDAEIICRDFMTFCNYMIEHKVKPSKKTGHIGKKDCFELNKLFYWKEDYEQATRFQTYYPLIHFFYFVALKYRILEITKSGTAMVYGKNYALFQKASAVEQYALFLVNFLNDERYMESEGSFYDIVPFLRWVDEEKPEEGKVYSVPCWILRFYGSHKTIAVCLHEFQLIRADRESLQKSKESYTPVEVEILPALSTVNYLYQMIEVREEVEDENELDRIYFERYMEILEPSQKEYILSELFVTEKISIPEQTIDLKVSMRYHDCSRTIRMNLSDSLHDLHGMIQLAFNFDDDHLYEFCIGKKPFQKRFAPEHRMSLENEYPSEDTALGELELRKGQTFTYLFDFGDSWWFEIKVEKTADGRIKEPEIIKSENEAPEQYPMYEDEDWDFSEDYDEDE